MRLCPITMLKIEIFHIIRKHQIGDFRLERILIFSGNIIKHRIKGTVSIIVRTELIVLQIGREIGVF